jgi:hypothetical protein
MEEAMSTQLRGFYGRAFGVWCKTAKHQWFIGGSLTQTEAEQFAREASATHRDTMVTVVGKSGNVAAFLNGETHDHSRDALMHWLSEQT